MQGKALAAETAEPKADVQSEQWNIPSLADTTLRAGRNSIKTTANTWKKYLRVYESNQGLTFSFTKAMGTVFEGLSHSVNLNGLCLKFSGYQNHAPNAEGTFAVSFGKGEYERFSFGLIFDTKNGRIYAGQASGSALAAVGEALLQNEALSSAKLEGQTWTVLLSKEFDGSYTLSITVGDENLRTRLPQDLVENSSYDPTNCYMSIMAVKNLPSFTLTLEGWKQIPRPRLLLEADTIMRGTGNYGDTLDSWGKWLKVTQKATGGLRYDFTGAAHSVTEGLTIPVSLDGLRVYFSGLETTDNTKLGRLCLTFGKGRLNRSAFGLIFEFGSGKIYASNAEISNGTASEGRVKAVGEPLFSGETFRYANMAGKDWTVDFSRMADGNYEVVIELDGQCHRATVDASVVTNTGDFRPEHCYAYLMSAQANTTLSIDLLAITRRSVPGCIDNSDVMPAYIPSTKVSVDANGTPTWLSSATIMEVNIPRATKEGTFDAAVSVLDHAQEMGVNCIWITSVGEPGTKNDGSNGNHYVNKGLQSIDPTITGTTDYEKGWQEFADFVAEAHARNIYIIFNAITWGTTSDSPIYQQHPDWYTGKEIWGGKAWDWSNEELISWYIETLLTIIETTEIDGILYDCEPEYADVAVCTRIRKAVQNSGRNLVYIGESANDRSGAYDLEQYGVMNYNGYSKTSAAIGEHQKDDKEFFVEEGFNIVDAVKNGTISGTIENQKNGEGGKHKYYTYAFSNHDSYFYAFNNNILDIAYQGFFSSYIPIWYFGDEFNATASGIRLYFDSTKWCNLAYDENAAFYEEVKQMLRIRREYGYVFDRVATNHRNTNICKVDTTGTLDLQAYARYADNTGILIVGNHNGEGKTVTTTITIPFDEMNLSRFDRFVVTDLLSGEILCRGSKRQVERFTATLDYDALGVYAVVGAGTANEGLTVARQSHALLRNGTAHQVNTATVAWSQYVQVEEASLNNGLHFSFTKAVTTTGEGVNVPVSLDNLSLQLDNLSGYENSGSSANPSTIALSFGPGGYARNSFGLIFDFENGAIYAAKPTSGTADRLTKDDAPLLQNDLLKASSLEGKEWSLQLKKRIDGSYLLTVTVCAAALNARIDASYITPTESFDPTNCYLYFTAAGANPTVSFDLVGWGAGEKAMEDFRFENVRTLSNADYLQLRDNEWGKGLDIEFREALPLAGAELLQELNLDGTTLYLDNLSNYRDYATENGSAKYAVTFASAASEATAFGIVFDPMYGRVYLCLNGCLRRQLLSDSGLTYNHFRDVQWTMSFAKKTDGSLDLLLQLPDGSYSANITAEELAEAEGFRLDQCNVNIMSWDGPLKLSLTLRGYRSTGCGHKPNYDWDVDGDDTLEILAIGNSFSTDALWYTWQIARDMGIEKIVIGNLYIADCSLKTHASNAAKDSAAYLYYHNDSGTWSTTSDYKISTALTDRSWDYVSLQQNPGESGMEASYNEDLTYLISYVKGIVGSEDNENRNSCTKLVWHMTWAFQQDSTHSAFVNYNHDQMTMYRAITSAVQNQICTNEDIDLIVPSATAIQNARTSLVGDTLTRDGYHMSVHYGRFLTGMMFMKTLTGLSVDEISYTPGDVTELYREIAKESVNHSYSTPFAVTQSAFTGEAPTEGYLLLQPQLTKGAYWNPTSETSYNRLITNAYNSKCFFATARFTKEELPVGSVIMLKEGWKYRPDGWITDGVQTTREGNTTEAYVLVTEQWWGDYSLRAFNISKDDSSSLENLTTEELRAAFSIYVPEEKHSHSYVDGSCICGAVEIVEPVLDSSVVIRHTLNLESDISILYVVQGEQLAEYDSFYLDCVIPDYEGNTLIGTTNLRIEPVLVGNYYYFTLSGMAAMEMNDLVEATLHMDKDGVEYVSVQDCYSVGNYAYSQLNKAAASQSLKTLCADLLRYGAAAQIYKAYRTDAPVDGAMTELHRSYLSDLSAVAFGNHNTTLNDVSNPVITWAGKTLKLESRVELKFVFDARNYSGSLEDLKLRVQYQDHTGKAYNVLLTESEPYDGVEGWYAFTFSGLPAAALRQPVSVAVFKGDTQLSSTLCYSADTYGNNKTGTLLELCKSLFAYSDAALSYFRSSK